MAAFDGRLEQWGQQCFSQFGEDVALWGALEGLNMLTPGGFFVDVGAHHPRRGSNTFLVRKLLGWNGINVEPDPNLHKVFLEECPECINLQMAVGKTRGTAELSRFNHPGVNTISESQRDNQIAGNVFSVVDTVTVEVRTMADILTEFLPKDADFRLLTVDAEGTDLDVLTSINFDVFRPTIVMIEDFQMNLAAPETSEIFRYLAARSYIPESHCRVTSLYRSCMP